MNAFLDVFLTAFHALLVAFNLTGWIWKRTRRLHLLVISLTVLSWVGFGFVHGFGYCPLTDWHWDVKRSLGETDLPWSYVKYHVDALTGGDWDGRLVDGVVLGLGLLALGASAFVNRRDLTRLR